MSHLKDATPSTSTNIVGLKVPFGDTFRAVGQVLFASFLWLLIANCLVAALGLIVVLLLTGLGVAVGGA